MCMLMSVICLRSAQEVNTTIICVIMHYNVTNVQVQISMVIHGVLDSTLNYD